MLLWLRNNKVRNISIILFSFIFNSSCSNPIVQQKLQREIKIEQNILKVNFFLEKKDYQNSLKLAKKILKYYTKKDFYYIIANQFLAKSYFHLKDYTNALKCLEESIQIKNVYKFPKDFPFEFKKKLIVDIYFKKGQVLLVQRKIKLAFNSLTKALEIIEENYKLKDEKFLLNEIFKSMGTLFFLNEEYHQSILYYHKALYYEDKNKNNLYKYLIYNYRKIIKKYQVKSNSFKTTPFLYGSDKFNKALTLYDKALNYFKDNNFEKALVYLNKTLINLDKIKDEDKIRTKILLAYINTLKASIYFEKSTLPKAYTFYKNTYTLYREAYDLVEIEELDKYKHNSFYSNDYNEFLKNEYYAVEYFFKQNYLEAYKYAEKILHYFIKENYQNINYKSVLFFFEKNSYTKVKYENNKMTYLNTISLVLSINHAYKNSLLTSNKVSKEVSEKSFTQWINFKGMDYIYESKTNINFKKISKKLSKNQLYIDIASGSQNYYIFTLDNQNNVTFQKISKKDTALINKNIYSYRNINQQLAKAIKNKNLSDKLESKLKITTQKYLFALEEIILKKYLLQQLKQKKSLIISPDGLLNFLPFEALYHNGKYLIEDYKISYISSGREFIRQTKRKEANPKCKMICFGNPDFNASLPISRIKGRFGGNNQIAEETWEQFKDFSSIGNSEIVTIKNLYKNAIIYEGKEATVENLMSVGSSKILHLSTHGKFLNSESIKNPMLKAGLAFSGANDRTSFSGIVTALQVSALDLQDTELVVLSACESGLGEVQNTEGVMGLPKAFLQAGARNVMMSLWSVSNQKTAMLMKKFYENVQKGQDYESALRTAKLKMIEMHPYYWSAFIMHGFQN